MQGPSDNVAMTEGQAKPTFNKREGAKKQHIIVCLSDIDIVNCDIEGVKI